MIKKIGYSTALLQNKWIRIINVNAKYAGYADTGIQNLVTVTAD